MKSIKVQPVTLISHEFKKIIDVWENEVGKVETLKLLVTQKRNELVLLTKFITSATIGSIWMANNSTNLKLKVPIISSLEIPISIVVFSVSILLIFSILQFVNYIITDNLISAAVKKFYNSDISSAVTLPLSASNAWVIGFMQQYKFINSGYWHRKIPLLLIVFSLMPILPILIFEFYTVFTVGKNVLSTNAIFSLESTFVWAGWLSLVTTFIVIVTLFIPFTFAKNKLMIRWGFLFLLYRKSGQTPPRMDNWLDDPIK